jgi:hypothetical protein
MAYEFTRKTDAVDDVMAVDVNELQAALEAHEFLTLKAATEKTIASDAITATQAAHKLQPESSTADDLATINGMDAGDILILYVSDAGTDTITIKHGTGNISCSGAADIAFTQGAVICYFDGTTVYVSGGGGGAAGIANVVEDTTPQLGGDLDLNGHHITDQPLGQNLIINGGFRVAQRGVTFTAATAPLNSDDTYLLDRWILLSDGNDIVDVSQLAVTSDENPFALQALVATANKKFGFLQILETKDSPQIGQVVSLSFRAKTTAAAIRNVRAAVISWDGTADTVTSDVVSAWEAEGTVPTLAAGWTYENAATNNLLTTSWQTFTIENIAVDTAATKNVAVFIWVDDADAAANDILQIEWVKLELGATATNFVPRPYAEELLLCQRYFIDATEDTIGMATYGFAGQAFYFTVYFPARMRAAPTITLSSPTSINCGAHSSPNITTIGFRLQAVATADARTVILTKFTASSEL